MDIPHSLDPDKLEVELARRIDLACRAFEDDWRAGRSPRIEDRLEDVPESARPALLVELIALECELLVASGAAPEPDGFLARFPGREPEIARAFQTRDRTFLKTPTPGTSGREVPTIAPPPLAVLAPTERATPDPADAPGPHDVPTLPPSLPPADGVTTLHSGDGSPSAPGPRSGGESPRVRYFGDYLLERELARGGMGVVYKARQVNLHRTVALKMILAGQLASEDDVRRFYIEAESAANLDHPGIVPIFEVGQHEGQHYFSMGFVEGQSLAQKIADHPLPTREAAALMVALADAVQYAHDRGVIHRDLKPGNVLLDAQGRPRVTDFGLAKKLQGDSGLTATGQVMGTPSYMPPEQAAGKHEVDHRSDVYSLGAVLYCMLTGRPPFQAAGAIDTLVHVLERDPVSPRQLNPDVPRDVETIVLKALQKEPGKRYESARALGADLDRWLRGEPILARPVSRGEKVAKWARRRPGIAGLSAAVVLIGLVGLSGILWQWRRAERNLAEAEKNREIAQENYEEATDQRTIADSKTAEAQARAEELERQSYVWLIAIGQRETQAHNVALSDRLLERCTPRLRGWEWHYATASNHAELATIRQPGRDRVRRGVSSPDGKRFACSSENRAWICNARGKELLSMTGHSGPIYSIAWSPDGQTIATGATDREIRLWNAETGAERGILKGHGIWVKTLCFSPDGQKLVSGAGADAMVPGRRHEVRLWDLARREEIRTLLSGPGGGVESVAFSPDGKRVAAGTVGGGAHVWVIEDGKQIREFVPTPHQGTIFAVTFAPDGRSLAAGSEAGVITLWDIESGSLVRRFNGHEGDVFTVRFSRDGRRLASGSRDSTIRLWDVSDGGMKATFHGHVRTVDQLEFDPTQARLLSSSLDGTIKVWDATVETHPAAIWGHTGWTNTLSFHPDGKTLASGGWGGIHVWDAASGRRLDTMHSSHYGGPHCIAYSPDGKQLAAVGHGPVVQVWDLATKRLVHDIKTKSAACTAVVFTPDSTRLIVGDNQGYVRILSLASDSEVREFAPTRKRSRAFPSPPTGARLATASPGDVAKVWDILEGRELLTIKTVRSYSWPTAQIAVFDHSGRRLAIRRENHSVAIVQRGDGCALAYPDGPLRRDQHDGLLPGRPPVGHGRDRQDGSPLGPRTRRGDADALRPTGLRLRDCLVDRRAFPGGRRCQPGPHLGRRAAGGEKRDIVISA